MPTAPAPDAAPPRRGVARAPQRPVVVIHEASPRAAVARALAVHDGGGVPLVLDDRWSGARAAAVAELADRHPAPANAAWATLTSGTTSAARVVVRSHDSWADSFTHVSALLALRGDDVLYLPSPPCSSLTLFSVVHARDAGVAVALPSGHTVRARDHADATVLHGTPGALRAVVEHVEAGAPTRLRVALVGGSHLPPGLVRRARAVGIDVVAYYGAAELSFVAVDTDGRGLRPFPDVDVDVRDGELWVRSPFTAAGYLDGDGPLRTDGDWATVGDRARVDDGRIAVLGRSDGAILTASATVVPRDVEAALEELPGVRDVVVLGVPRARVGSLVVAVLETSSPPALADLRAACASLLPSHRPRRWYAVGALPRTGTGKPARAEVLRLITDEQIAPLA